MVQNAFYFKRLTTQKVIESLHRKLPNKLQQTTSSSAVPVALTFTSLDVLEQGHNDIM